MYTYIEIAVAQWYFPPDSRFQCWFKSMTFTLLVTVFPSIT